MTQYSPLYVCCPITRKPLLVADKDLLQSINKQIMEHTLLFVDGSFVEESVQSGLINQDSSFFYIGSNSIPLLFPDGAIPLL